MFSARLITAAVTFALAAVLPARGAQFNVTVGGSALKFDPEFVNATVGDTIVFNFHAKNHTATQSSFANPCAQIAGGFDTGFVPVSVNNTEGPFPAASLTITDENPIWVFCAQAGHCSAGMVFAVNPGEKFDAFKATAMGASTNSSSSATPSSSASSSSAISSASGTSNTVASASSTAVSSSSAAPSSPGVASSTASSTSTASTPASTTSATATTTTSSSSSSSYSFVPPPMTASVSRPAPTPSAVSSDHRILVGSGGLTFSPANVTAEIGDTLTFEFRSGNHSATASSFGAPCVPLGDASPGNAAAFDSGFVPVAAGVASFPTFTVQINNTQPVWVFCKQANHCGQGMVFSVNAKPESANSFPAFLANAEKLNGTTNNAGSGTTKSAAGRAWAGSVGAVYLAIAALGVVVYL